MSSEQMIVGKGEGMSIRALCAETGQTSGLRSPLCDGKHLQAQIESRTRCPLAYARRQTDRGFSGSAG